MKNFKFFYLFALLALITSCRKTLDEAKPIHQESPSRLVSARPDAEISDFEIVAYMPYWALPHYREYDLQYQNITTLIMLAAVSRDGVLDPAKNGLVWGDSEFTTDPYYQPDIKRMMDYIRFVNPNIKIFLGLADLFHTSSRFEAAQLFRDSIRSSTISWIMNRYIDTLDFDGIDLDFEDVSLEDGYIFADYPKIVKDLHVALRDTIARGRKKLCTITLGGDWWRTHVVTDTVRKYADWLGFQTYSSEKMDHIVANANRDVKYYLSSWTSPSPGFGNMPANKLLVGLTGHAIRVNSLGAHVWDSKYNYYDLLTFPTADTAVVPYLTTSQDVYLDTPAVALRYNGLYETRRKLEWAEASGIKGVFFWDISKDAECNYSQYSLIQLLNHAHSNPGLYDDIVGYTTQDFYTSGQDIVGGFHSFSMPSSAYNWVGVYELHSGTSTGYYQYLSTGASGTFTIPSTLTDSLDAGKLYFLKFYNGAGGIGTTFYGTSHPFLKQ